MGLKVLLEKLKLEPYVIALFGMVVLASILPVRGETAHSLSIVVKLAIALLFFLHGAKLSRESVVAGVTHWRLHLLILAFTFVMFPVLGLVISKIGVLPPTLHAGQVSVADGTEEAAKRLNRVLTNDPGLGVARMMACAKRSSSVNVSR